ncbi:peptidylprolyl isomerase [Coprobacter tertius]|uniref:Peptidylprolyl isomerase n=1 Tax=Coprobacter tertius TaxID=2944915 RepID=A0ABT1MJE2_9BACT|nr:peptidylprolyl isomerase [Coprobacter tertius]MCP9612174.1 peptidylprolyl isomerase [Coprobacter tertius]
MKKNWLVLSLFMGCVVSMTAQNADNDPEIMKVNGKSIKKSEFEYIYNKNNQQQIDHKSLDEYVVLFKNYKLKVAEAEAHKIDTTRAFQTELAGYRKQLAKPYLVDTSVDDKLAQEAYDRLKEEIKVSHILFNVNPGSSVEEKEKVHGRALEVLNKIRNGADFNKMADEYSEDPSVRQNHGNLGYITGFRTVYPFEMAAYQTPVGSVSEPVETQFGYHLVKVWDRRPSRGEILTAHIMIMTSPEDTPDQAKAKEAKIKEIYQEVIQGGDFAKIAREKSEDTGSAQKGGEMPWISTGRIVPEYEEAAFALKNVGDISQPIKTAYGWHIIRLLDKRALKPYDEMKPLIMRTIARDERGTLGQKVLIGKLKKEYHFTINETAKERLNSLISTAYPTDSLYLATIANDRLPLFTLDGEIYKISDFAQDAMGMRRSVRNASAKMMLDLMLDAYVNKTVLNYEDSQLERKYPDFRNLMNEYRDGMLLFEISNQEVWDKASKDEVGLAEYFKKNKKKYRWDEPKYKGFVVKCSSKEIAKQVKKRIKTLPIDSVVMYVNKEFNNDTLKQVRIERGLFVKGDNEIVDKLAFKIGEKPVDSKFPVIFVSGKMLKKGPQVYTDIRGQVTADYQNYLEEKWVEQLNLKYPVEIHEDVLKTVKKD